VWLSPLFEFVQQWFPRFAEIEAPISVNVNWMHLYFDGFSDEMIHVAGFYPPHTGTLLPIGPVTPPLELN